MGASGWWYEVDFHPDLSVALSELQQRILESGEYAHPWNSPWYQPDAEFDEELLQESAEESGIDEGGLRASMERLKSGQPPLSTEHLLALVGPDGTHSILDMVFGVGAESMSVAALDASECLRVFGTESPTLDEVRAKRNELMERRGRWMGTAVIAHEGASQTRSSSQGSQATDTGCAVLEHSTACSFVSGIR